MIGDTLRCDRDFCDRVRPVQKCPIPWPTSLVRDSSQNFSRLYAKYRFRVSRVSCDSYRGPEPFFPWNLSVAEAWLPRLHLATWQANGHARILSVVTIVKAIICIEIVIDPSPIRSKMQTNFCNRKYRDFKITKVVKYIILRKREHAVKAIIIYNKSY